MNPRFIICIPTYNNPETIEQVARDCLAETNYPVLIIDDGSDRPVQSGLKNSVIIEALQADRIRIIRFEHNRGKGVALQQAIKNCVSRGFTHMIAIDGDGQHFAHQIQKLVTLAIANPWDLIIGNRKLDAATVPGASKFGRGFSNFWVKFQTEKHVADSQSGFRVYPLFHLQNLKFHTRRFDFEIEVMIRLLWRGVMIQEAEIEVHYPPPEERVSHFHKLWDNVRISTLNTILVALTLLRTSRSPRGIALAVGLGVWVGCTPLFGFHTAIVILISLATRLNLAYLWLGTQISIPPLAPLLAIASVRIGEKIAGGHLNSIHGVSKDWFLGSLLLGAGLGLAAGSISYWVSRSFSKGREKSNWNGKNRGGAFGNWFLKTLLRIGGLKPAYFCLSFIVPYFYLFAPQARRSANEYWQVVRPEIGFWHRQSCILKQLFQFARIMLDRVYQSHHSDLKFQVNGQGKEFIFEPVKTGQGLILLSAHVGGWDLAASALRHRGLPGEFHMVRFEAEGVTLEKLKAKADESHLRGLATNRFEQPVLHIRQVLDSGKPVALMADRPIGGHFELVLFFGRLAPIDLTPFRIAAACGSPLLFTFGFKGVDQQYDFYATPAKRYEYSPTVDKIEQRREWAQEFAFVLESYLRKYPEQWSNFFPFWSSVPQKHESIQT